MLTGLSTTVRLAVVVAILAAVLILLGPAACNAIRSASLQHRVDQGQSKALGNSAVDAVQTQGNVSRNEVASEDLGRTNAEEILNAQDSGTRSPAAHAAGLRAVCRRPVNRDREQCRLLNASRP